VTGRPLSTGETALARSVFGASIRLEEVRLQHGGFSRFGVTLGSRIYLPAHLARDDFAAADIYSQALLVHELVHVWQFQTRPWRTLASWGKAVLMGGYGPGLAAYRYALPVSCFSRLGLERQASAVEHLFLLLRGYRTTAMPPGLTVSDLASAVPVPLVV
jgi:hypothetical protein